MAPKKLKKIPADCTITELDEAVELHRVEQKLDMTQPRKKERSPRKKVGESSRSPRKEAAGTSRAPRGRAQASESPKKHSPKEHKVSPKKESSSSPESAKSPRRAAATGAGDAHRTGRLRRVEAKTDLSIRSLKKKSKKKRAGPSDAASVPSLESPNREEPVQRRVHSAAPKSHGDRKGKGKK